MDPNLAGASAAAAAVASLAHTIPVPPPADPTQPLQQVAMPEPTLVDVLLCDHQHCLALLDHFTLAAAQGNAHAVELLAGAAALDMRLHCQAEREVLYPTLEQLLGAGGAVAEARAADQALEADMLEVLTCRRERNWARLAAAMQQAHQDYAAHVQRQEAALLPALLAGLGQAQLVAVARRYHQLKRSATLLPQVDLMPAGQAAVEEAGPVSGASARQAAPKESFPDAIELPETQPSPY